MIGRVAMAGVVTAMCSVLAAGSVGPAAAVAADSGAATVVVPVSPVSSTGHLLSGYRVTKHLSGATCRSHSPEVGNAYSCHVRYGFDPCWLAAKRMYVVCLSQPYGRKVTLLRVARYVNHGGLGNAKPLPWGLELTNGVKTTLIPGDFGKVSGKEIHYSYNQYKDVLVGSIDKSGPVWRIRRAKNTGKFRFKIVGWVDIKKAWVSAPSRLS